MKKKSTIQKIREGFARRVQIFKNIKNEMVRLAPDDFRVFIRVPKGTSVTTLLNLRKALINCKIVMIPEGWEVIVVRSNGYTDKL